MDLFFHGSASVDIYCRHISEKKSDLQHQYGELGREIDTTRNQYMQLKKNIDQLNVSRSSIRQNRITSHGICSQGKERQLQNTLRSAKVYQSNLQHEANEDMPVGVQGLEEAKQVRSNHV